MILQTKLGLIFRKLLLLTLVHTGIESSFGTASPRRSESTFFSIIVDGPLTVVNSLSSAALILRHLIPAIPGVLIGQVWDGPHEAPLSSAATAQPFV